MNFHFQLKHQYPWLLLVAAFALVAFMSFKHEPPAATVYQEPASTASATDQLQYSSMHAEPVPSGKPNLPPGTTPQDLSQIQLLDQLLVARNDNDPRLDTELRHFSNAGKALLRAKYAAIPAEKRNERGTVVLLVGRDINSAEDVAFLREVLSEEPCRSLANCKREDTGSVTPEDRHWEGVNEISLSYPQLLALKWLEAYVRSPNRNPELAPRARAELEAAKHSPIRKVASLAEALSAQLSSTPTGSTPRAQ